ncbi:MAG: AI-2E family transporter [Pirellula sp.]|nr:AI-2E family transporter [Pirellula sp.]
MARYISFAVLLAILTLIGILFYKVMIGFFVPVFIAVVLVVVFQPLHRWVLKKTKGRTHLAASLTTLLIVGSVLLPAGLIVGLAGVQGFKLLGEFNESNVRLGLSRLRSNKFINLESPAAVQFRSIDAKLAEIKKVVAESTSYAEVTDPQGRMAGDIADVRSRLKEIPDAILEHSKDKAVNVSKLNSVNKANKNNGNKNNGNAPLEVQVRQKIEAYLQSTFEQIRLLTATLPDFLDSNPAPEDLENRLVELREQAGTIKSQIMAIDGLDPSWIDPLSRNRAFLIDQTLEASIASAKLNHSLKALAPSDIGNLTSLQESVWSIDSSWQASREELSGGRFVGILKEVANPSPEQVRQNLDNLLAYLQPHLISFGGGSVAFVIKLLVGLTILLVSLYFFLCDGPSMVRTLMDLSPLDNRYEEELLAEFDRTSRAIVLATVLSAVAQGLTAGIAYYFLGAPSVFLLTALTIVCALIPFVGTAIVWVPVATYMALYQDKMPNAIILAVYALLIVGTIDNLIKMLILHGQSQLHPLLALLSVLGGLQALGPIGILIGPLAVTLLQTTLSILRRELSDFNGLPDPTKTATT